MILLTLPTTIISKPGIDIAHQRIHEGNAFDVSLVSTGVNIANPKQILIMVPHPETVPSNTIEIHLIFSVISVPGFTVRLFENPTVTDNGTSLDIINHNRRSSTTSGCSVYENTTVSSDGTLLFIERIGTAITGGSLTMRRDEDEYILKPGFDYLIRITPLADNTTMSISLDWYDNRPSSPIPFEAF